MKIENAKTDRYGYHLAKIQTQTFYTILRDQSIKHRRNSYKGLSAQYKKDDNSTISIYFPDTKPSIINKRILKEKLVDKTLVEVMAENKEHILKIDEIELANLTEEAINDLIALLQTNTKDKHYINYIKKCLNETKNNTLHEYN